MNWQASWRTHTRSFTFALSMAVLPVLSVHAQQSAKKVSHRLSRHRPIFGGAQAAD